MEVDVFSFSFLFCEKNKCFLFFRWSFSFILYPFRISVVSSLLYRFRSVDRLFLSLINIATIRN